MVNIIIQTQQQDIPYKRFCNELIDMDFDMGQGMGQVTNYENCEELIKRYNASAKHPIPLHPKSNMNHEYIGLLADFINPFN